MPFKIIRNDITKVAADAIVNTANPEPTFAAGTDGAVYKAAGAKELLAARQKIGRIAPGEAAVTDAFQLPAKFIIHTVGPSWIDGNHGEFEILRSCYRKSLLLADQLGCESIAFPLIATGIYGFPKDQALQIALTVIREHLENSDLDVTLVVFGRDSYQIAAGLIEKVEEYIDENYVAVHTEAEYGFPISEQPETSRRPGLFRRRRNTGDFRRDRKRLEKMESPQAELWEEEDYCAAPSAAKPFSNAQTAPVPKPSIPVPGKPKASLEDVVNNLGESFQTRLLRMIDERGMTDPEVYKRANVDRKLFSKIRCSEHYTPKKKTIVALAIALRLNLDDTRDLLASAGLVLANNSKADVIVSFCIERGIYDIYEVNALLFQYGEPILG